MLRIRRERSLGMLTLAALLCVAAVARADSPRPLVVSSIRPLHLIALALAGERLDARVLLEAGASPHDFALRPSQLRLLASAQQVFWIGPALEHPLVTVLPRLGGPARDTPLLGLVGAKAGGDGFVDPHIWLDPRLATATGRAMAGVLTGRGLAAPGELDSRLQAFDAAMELSERRIREAFRGLEGVPFVAMHDGYAHFVSRFGLNQAAVLALDSEQQVGAKALTRMRAQARASGAVCLLRESTGSATLARAVAEGTALRVVELDSLAASAPEHPEAYARFLEQFAQAVAGCLRGPAPEAPKRN